MAKIFDRKVRVAEPMTGQFLSWVADGFLTTPEPIRTAGSGACALLNGWKQRAPAGAEFSLGAAYFLLICNSIVRGGPVHYV